MAQPATPITNKPASVKKLNPIPSAGRAEAARPKPKSDFVETLWALMCSVRFAVVLNVALAGVAMLGTIIPQMPAGIQNFPTELSTFLDTAHTRYGDLSGFMYWAGFYNLYNSLWFRLLVVTVVFSITMCTLNRWQPIIRQISTPPLRFGDAFIGGLSETAAFRNVPVAADVAAGALQKAMRRSRYRVVSGPSSDGQAILVYGDRDRWSKLVTFVSHAALVLVILIAAGMANLGWREQSVYFYPGQPVNVGHGTDFSVRNDGFSIDYYADGTSIKEYKNTLSVIENGKVVTTKTIIVNDPLRYKDTNFFLVSYQPVAYAKVSGPDGAMIALRNMSAGGPVTATMTEQGALVKFEQTNSDNLPTDIVQLPAGGHFVPLQLTYYQDVSRLPNENPPLYAQAFLDQNFTTPIFDGFIPRTGPLKIPGYGQYSWNFTKDTTTILEIAKDPGLTPVAVFFTIMALGFTLSLYTTFTRCWARISPSEERPGAINLVVGGLAEKNKVTFERDFERLAERIKNELAGATARTDASAPEITAGNATT